jgi:hypothetical protein
MKTKQKRIRAEEEAETFSPISICPMQTRSC